MNILDKIIISFKSQGTGFIFIFLIVVVLATGILVGIKVKSKYRYLLREFYKSEEIKGGNGTPTGEREISNDELKSMVEDFKKSAKRGTENINTEVIIQKRLSKSIINSERLIKLLPSIAIALGLLGTFLGLTLAIIDTKGILGGIESMAQFSEKMTGPFNSMSSAFWTSIFGVSSSLILNFFNLSVENTRESFYDCIEDYLDNNIYAMYAKNFTSQFSEFNNIIRKSMMDLTKDMRSLFQDGVHELVSKINSNTIDLTKTVDGLSNYTKDLDRLTKSLNSSVDNFKEPVDKFKVSIYEFTSISEELSTSMRDSMNKFAYKVDLLDSNLNNLYNSIDTNKKEISSIGILLKQESNALNHSYNKVIELVNTISNIQTGNNEELIKQINKLNTGYVKFETGLIQFVDNLKSLQLEISKGISDTLQSEMTSLTNNIVDRLGASLNEVTAATEQLTKNSLNIGELVKATNELYFTTNKVEHKEVALDEI